MPTNRKNDELELSFDPYDYPDIPVSTLQSLKAYVEERRPTGDFLHAVLSNDLKGAFMRGDRWNIQALHSIVRFVYYEIPMIAQGSPDKVIAFLRDGMIG